MELAGEVEAVGTAVSEFAVGDHVFGVKGFGAHAEFTCIREASPLAQGVNGSTMRIRLGQSCRRRASRGALVMHR